MYLFYVPGRGFNSPHLQSVFYTDTIDEVLVMDVFLAITFLVICAAVSALIGGFIGKVVSILHSPFIKRSLKKRGVQ